MSPSFTDRNGRPRAALLVAAPLLFVAGALCALTIPLLAARADLARARTALVASRAAVKERRDPAARRALDRAARALASAAAQAHQPSMRAARAIPLLGSPARAVEGATRAGRETVAAARVLLDAAASFPGGSAMHIDGHDLSAFATAATSSRTALATAESHLHAAHRALDGPSGAALPPVSSAARAMRRVVDDTTHQLDGAARGLDLLSHLAAPDADYKLLLLSQDSMELRPTGGFIGSFGVIHFAHGTVNLEKYASYEELPQPNFPANAPADLAIALNPDHGWRLENVNWWPDFPHTAAAARDMYRRQGGGEVDGVVAMTEAVMSRLVGVLGPFQVPGYDKPVVEAGFDKRVLYEVELKRPLDTPRKKFLTLLSDQVFQRLFHPEAQDVPRIVKAIDASVGAGDIQAWFTDPGLQRNVTGTKWAGTLPKTSQDFLLMTEANLTSGKANADLTRHASYRVQRDSTGHLVAHLNVVYRNDGDKTPINPYYNGFLRVYVPRGARLLPGQRSMRDEGVAPDAPSYRVFARSVYVEPHDQEIVDISYTLPDSVAPHGRYHLTWVRQPGTSRDALTVLSGTRTSLADPRRQDLNYSRPLGRHRINEALHRSWVFRKIGF